ncbi:MAG: DUF1552 domain-containing protein [Verrucomicrobiota bacterium]|nr:DUF1552 domain-containing protein [Verrucomicrobiota bacterium]
MHIPNQSVYLPRRTFLRGLGACIALPLLECMLPAMARAAAGAASSGAPRRLVFVYMPNGMDMDNWTPKSTGSSFELPSILQPLQPHRGQISVLSGLAHGNARSLGDGPGDHARANACFLTGVHPRKTAGADIHVGISADQIAALQVGKATRLPSLELSCETSVRQAGACDSGYACSYQNNISWRNENTPMPPIFDPRLVFERLFTNEDDPDLAAGRALRESCRASILDIVREDAKAFQGRLGATDRRKVDEYLTSLRETEVAIAQQAKFKASIPRPKIAKPEGIPGDFTEHLKIMYDLLALALQTDSTRIATMMVQREGSNRPYPWIGVTEGHHDVSHHGHSAEKKAKIAKINRYHMEQFAGFLGKLKSMREVSGSVLDNSMIVCGSAIADGNRHGHSDLPVLLCGAGAGALKPGRHVQYGKDTPMTNLYLSLLERMKVTSERIGDSTGPLKDV